MRSGRKILRRAIATSFWAVAAAAAWATGAVAGLSEAELAALGRGETVVRSLGSWKELAAPGPQAIAIRDEVRPINPNYLVEVIVRVPRKGNEKALERLASALADVEGYVGIPYYSTQYKRAYKLFSSTRVLGRNEGPDGIVSIDAAQAMQPFGELRMRYELRASAKLLRFRGTNSDTISYQGIKAVRPGQLVWQIAAYPDGDSFFFYGVGAVKAFDMLGALRGRMETSFVGRAEAFLQAMQRELLDEGRRGGDGKKR